MSVLTIGTKPNEKVNVFKPLSWQIPAWRDKSPIMLLSGAAGGGKSRLAGEKLHAFCLKYPGAMCLMARKTRESTTNSIVLMMDRIVIGNVDNVVKLDGKHRFEYSNGSILAWGGMKDDQQRDAIRSIGQDGALDMVWLEEAHLFDYEDFQELLPRMRGKAADWTQIIPTTNPDAPNHWIKKRLIDGKLASYHRSAWYDNPYNPPDYENTLNMLTGYQRDKLRDGLWVMAEGAIYPEWSVDNITHEAEYDPNYPLYWAVDDGYSNPRAILLIQERPCLGKPDRICIFAEYYRSNQLAVQSIQEVKSWGYPLPEFVFYDPSALEFAANAQSEGLATWAAANAVAEGIKTVRRFVFDGNNERQLLVHPRCENLIEQMASYRYKDSGALQGGDPQPVKEDDHAVDALRYFIYTRHLND